MKAMTLLGLMASLLLLAVIDVAGQEIDSKNWLNHPRIVAIRQQVASIDAKVENVKVTQTTVHIDGPEGSGFDRTKFFDQKRLVKYSESGGGDFSLIEDSYYDANGKLLFQFNSMARPNGPGYEIRSYLENGKVIWMAIKDKRYKDGEVISSKALYGQANYEYLENQGLKLNLKPAELP